MPSSHLYWPSQRKLFRQRSRARAYVAFVAGALVAAWAAFHFGRG